MTIQITMHEDDIKQAITDYLLKTMPEKEIDLIVLSREGGDRSGDTWRYSAFVGFK